MGGGYADRPPTPSSKEVGRRALTSGALWEISLPSLTGYCSFGDRGVKNLKLGRRLPCVSLVLMSMLGVYCDRVISLKGAVWPEET